MPSGDPPPKAPWVKTGHEPSESHTPIRKRAWQCPGCLTWYAWWVPSCKCQKKEAEDV